MSVRIRAKYLSNATAVELRQINHLTLKSPSLMRDYILRRKKYRDGIRIFLAKDSELDNKVVAWTSVILPHPNFCIPVKSNSQFAPIYTYVRHSHRKRGIGKRLLQRAANYIQECDLEPIVYGWDTVSYTFFCSLAEDIGMTVRDYTSYAY